MEKEKDLSNMMELIARPAFCVRDGIIVQTNSAAHAYMVTPGTPIDDILHTGKEEYAALSGGCLFLSLEIENVICGASVSKVEDADLFLIEETVQTELKSLALAGQELRVPMGSLMGCASRFASLAEKSSDSALAEEAGKINRSLFQMLRMISNMTDAYRYATSGDSHPETIDVCALLKEQFDAHAQLLSMVGTELRFAYPSKPIICLADTQMLERAVSNLVLNAVKFSPAGSPVIAKLAQKGNMLHLVVQNKNRPSKAGKIDVFDRFRRSPGIEDSHFGIGLGMVLISSVATAMGGTVLLEQSPKLGTRVTMTMAVRKNSNQVRTPVMRVDYAGEWDHKLLELSEILPKELYYKENKD